MLSIPVLHPIRAAGVLLAVVCALGLAACNGDGSSAGDPGTGVQTTVSAAPGTPEAAVHRLWTQIGAGSPTLTSEYDPRLVRLLGRDLILKAWDSAPAEYASAPRVKKILRLPAGVIVEVEGRGSGKGKPIPVSFLVAKVKGRWVVRYDSTLINRVRGQVAADFKEGLPRTKATEEQAAAAANRAVLRARTLFATGPRKGKLSSP